MADIWPRIVVLGLAIYSCSGRVNAQQEQNVTAPPALPTLTPPLPPPWVFVPHPDPLPSPEDAPVPDLGTLPGTPDKSKSRLKRAVDRLAPRCLDAATHTCWSSPPGEEFPKTSEAGREFTKDMEAGDLYFKDRNYKGAELRFRDALDHKPDQPDATFRLAETLDGLGQNEEAQAEYQSYLKIQPSGPYADRARMAVQRFEKKFSQKKLELLA
jgi:hypothetical protein